LAGSPKRSYANAFSDKHRNSSNIFSIDLEIDHAKVLLQTAVKLVCLKLYKYYCKNFISSPIKDEDKDAKFISQVVTDFADMKFFFVYGFDQDPNLSYSFITSNKAVLYHRNLIGGVQGFSTNVTDLQNFAMRQQKDVFAEDVPQDQPCKRLNEDNFTISVKISYRLDENFRV
jgi:hypothetical protein